MRIVIELKRDAVPQVVLNKLFKHTPLQTTFGYNAVALVDGVPRTLGLRPLLQHYLDYRKTHDIDAWWRDRASSRAEAAIRSAMQSVAEKHRFQLRENLEDTCENIEVGSRADVSLVRRKAIKHERKLQFMPIRSLQAMPTLQSSRDAHAAIFEGRRLDTLLGNTAEDEWLGGAINFRNGHLHSHLYRI